MPVFEDLFTQAEEENVQKKILQELREIKQLMIPKVIYVPIYIEQKPWWHCEPLNYVYPETYTIDYMEHVCSSGYSVST